VSGVLLIARYALRESLRRRVFAVVLVLTIGFLALYGLGTWQTFREVRNTTDPTALIDENTLAGATLLGLAMFATLFLGAVLAVFLTHGAIRGDAERGVLQPLVVRPVGRAEVAAGRLLAAIAVCAIYVVVVFGASIVITGAFGDWWPSRIVVPALQLALGVGVIAALTLLGSVLLSATANGIAAFMVFGAGLTAGLLGQIGEALDSHTLERIASISTWALPFEALYQSALSELTAETQGITRIIVSLGPFGGAQGASGWLWPWVVGYVVAVWALTVTLFRRRDL
jgi:ABC-type transport system involved in multi-copper enzyme maturation permease subunit